MLSFLSILFLNALGVGAGGSSLAPLNEPLALKYIDEACEAKNLTQFYLTVRSTYQADRMYPPWSDPYGLKSEYISP